jgi:hypothetical protein
METSLFMNSRNKHLCLLAKKQFITDNDISLKLRGLLDTVTSSNQIDAVLMKVITFLSKEIKAMKRSLEVDPL